MLRTLYGRISGVYLLLSLVLVLAGGWMTVRQVRLFANEVEQKLNRELAGKLVEQEAARLEVGAYEEALAHADMQTTMFFPALEPYVLDADGRILASLQPDSLKIARLDPGPLVAIQDPDATLPLWSPDPMRPQDAKVFSAAPAPLANGETGYLYVILRGQAAGSAEQMVQNSYVMRSLPLFLLLTIGFTALVGLFLFGLLTRRFRALTTTVHGFKEGDFTRRTDVQGNDEIGRLGLAFNEMADTIQTQVDVLRRTDAERRKLIANITHDFRTPLTSIRGHAERLRDRGRQLPAPQRQADLDVILKNTDRLEHLAGHLKHLSQLDARTLEPHLEPFALNEVAQDLLLKFQPQAERWGVCLTTDPDPDLPAVCADIGLVERLLSNLIQNGLENTPHGGCVHLTLAEADARVRVTVRDTGQGIAAEHLPLVQQRFYQTNQPKLNGEGGSGLGLSIAHEIAALHESDLRIASTPGQGTTVTFDLPLGVD
ncbi:MAG: HAMP domain-containing sensor histidine kinase [Bacteroidota bacterium]